MHKLGWIGGLSHFIYDLGTTASYQRVPKFQDLGSRFKYEANTGSPAHLVASWFLVGEDSYLSRTLAPFLNNNLPRDWILVNSLLKLLIKSH